MKPKFETKALHFAAIFKLTFANFFPEKNWNIFKFAIFLAPIASIREVIQLFLNLPLKKNHGDGDENRKS